MRRHFAAREVRLAAAAVVAVGALALGGHLLLRHLLDPAAVTLRLEEAVGEASGGAYAFSVDRATAAPLRRTLRLEGVNLERPGYATLAAEAVEVGGVGWVALLLRGRLEAGELRIERPVIRLVRAEGEEPGHAGPPAPLPLRLARTLPTVRVARLVVRDGVLCVSRVAAEPCPTGATEAGSTPAGVVRAYGIEATLEDLRLDREGAAHPARALFAHRLELGLDSLHATARDGLTHLTTGPVWVASASEDPPPAGSRRW